MGKRGRKISRKRLFTRFRAVALLSYASPATTVARETGLLVKVHFIRKNGPLNPRPCFATNFAAPVGRRWGRENILHGKPVSSFCTSSADDFAPSGGFHPGAKSVLFYPLNFFRLIRSFGSHMCKNYITVHTAVQGVHKPVTPLFVPRLST